MEELIRYLKALVLLQLQAGNGRDGAMRSELLLANAGFAHREIADLLGKTPAAVQKAVSRSRLAQPKEEVGDE